LEQPSEKFVVSRFFRRFPCHDNSELTPHEIFHEIGFFLSEIPSCIQWDVTNPTGGLQLEIRFLAGVLGGLAFHFAVGACAAALLIFPEK
jgi:hypothetical protein